MCFGTDWSPGFEARLWEERSFVSLIFALVCFTLASDPGGMHRNQRKGAERSSRSNPRNIHPSPVTRDSNAWPKTGKSPPNPGHEITAETVRSHPASTQKRNPKSVLDLAFKSHRSAGHSL
jgi:hypothetical protein